MYDRETDTIERVSVSQNGDLANNWSYYPALNDDGRFVTFRSVATNLVPEDTNGADDIFHYDHYKGHR